MRHSVTLPRPARGLLIGLALCLLLVPLAGCGRAEPPPEPVEITFRHPDKDQKFYQNALAGFNEKYPYITVKLATSGSTADCFVDESYDLMGLVNGEKIVNLNPFLDQHEDFDKSDFVPGILDIFTTENKLWAVPAGFNPAVMYYNQDLFDRYGVAYPAAGWTLDDFLAAAMAIRDPENNIFGYASPPAADVPDALMFLYSRGGRILDDLQNPTRVTLDDPATIAALDWYVRLINDYNVAPTQEQIRTTFGTDNRSVYRGILQSQVGMWIGWFQDRGGLTWNIEWPMKWGVVPLPRGDVAVTMAFAEGYFISASSPSPEACWQWISYLSRQATASMAPPRRSLIESEAYERSVGREAAATARSAVENVILVSAELAEYEDVLQIFYMALLGVLDGQLTADEALTFAQQEWNARAIR